MFAEKSNISKNRQTMCKLLQFHLFQQLPVPTEPAGQLDLFYEPNQHTQITQ